MAFWDKLGGKGNIEDRRGINALGVGGGLITAVIATALGYFGISADPALIEQLIAASGVTSQGEQSNELKGADSYETFASTVIGSTDRYWKAELAGKIDYPTPKLVLFRGATQSGCGLATSEVGPHYCPPDQSIFLDETFFDVLAERLGGNKDDVAQAYVMAHEVGHHVQSVTGTMQQVQQDSDYQATGSNSLSVRLELQADCYAGLWANSIRDAGVFESETEIQEAIDAAAAVGDDRIQSTTGSVNPETWTHGSSEQRVTAFKKGWSNTGIGTCTL
ncbi:neutral zinc metallopeptidase [Candidatus Saccharibacteria bacterium]|nr:neutral zinc metallopeptidase [Candidatus Saccharibacteria bacterium]